MIPGVNPRHLLVPALLLLACDDDERASVTLDGGRLDATVEDAFVNPELDASCTDTVYSDRDDDGFSRAYGDCDDCDPDIGPGNYDFPGNGVDEDCSGSDATLADLICDTDLEDDELEAEQVVRAFGLCGKRVGEAGRKQGLYRVGFTRLDASKQGLGDPRQLGVPEHFGVILPRQGARMLALSTGVARDVDADDYTPECDTFSGTRDANNVWSGGVPAPEGFPRDAEACGRDPISEGALAYDDVGFELALRAPRNARAFAFDSLFLTYEYPDFVCSRFNDFFVVQMDPAPAQAGDDDNILFDANDEPVGVNSALLAVCEKAERNRTAIPIACAQGNALLKDTGFGAEEATCGQGSRTNIGGASTGWLHTEMPIRPGETFRLRFALWDSGDPTLDSTVLLDNFRWLNTDPSGNTAPITTH